MKTRIHSVDNLCSYIQNVQIMDDLDARIANKEADLTRITNLEALYKNLGCEQMLDIAARSYNKLTTEIALLQLKRNEVEKHILEFELHALLED
jgi:hypothetical protein